MRAHQKALSSIEGVTGASVNLGSEKAEVAYDPGLASTSQMQAAIEEAGYQYLGVEGEETGDLEERSRARDLSEKLRRVVVGFAAGIPLMVVMFFPMAMHGSSPTSCSSVAAPVFAYISYPIFSAAWRALRNSNLNMDVMYAMGIGVSFAASLLGTFRILLSREFLFLRQRCPPRDLPVHGALPGGAGQRQDG